MKRKRGHAQASHDRWLISYADFITLLFAFFVVLFATSQSDKKKKQELAVSIHSAFSQMGIFEAHSSVPPLSPASGGGNSAMPLPADSGQSGTGLAGGGLGESPQAVMQRVKLRLEAAAQPEIDRGVIGLHESPDGLVVTLREAGFFDSGAANIRPTALPVLDRIAEVLPASPLRVEGHTDDVPIHTVQFASNWELSSNRASSIARLLLLHGNVHAEQLSVAGYAEFHPTASNDTADGRARNRRVDIVLLNSTH
jgi:chemotaxis protein MotB